MTLPDSVTGVAERGELLDEVTELAGTELFATTGAELGRTTVVKAEETGVAAEAGALELGELATGADGAGALELGELAGVAIEAEALELAGVAIEALVGTLKLAEAVFARTLPGAEEEAVTGQIVVETEKY